MRAHAPRHEGRAATRHGRGPSPTAIPRATQSGAGRDGGHGPRRPAPVVHPEDALGNRGATGAARVGVEQDGVRRADQLVDRDAVAADERLPRRVGARHPRPILTHLTLNQFCRSTVRLESSGPPAHKRLVFSILACRFSVHADTSVFHSVSAHHRRGLLQGEDGQRQLLLRAGQARAGGEVPRVRPHFRFRNRGIEYLSESGMKWMNGSAKQQCGRALAVPRAAGALIRVVALRPWPWSLASTSFSCRPFYFI
jgi:hypothetical protein